MQKSILFIYLISFTLLVFISCAQDEVPQEEIADKVVENVSDKGIPVEVLVIKKQVLRQEVTLSGVIQPIHKVDIISEVSGKVTRIIKDLGQRITSRDTLAYVDDEIPFSNYKQAQAQWLSAKNNLKIAQLNLDSDQTLFDSGDISELAYQSSQLALKTAEANLLSAKSALTVAKKGYRDTRITSPFSGQISRSHLDLGMMVQPGMSVYQVVDLSTLKLELGLSQDIIRFLQVGSDVQLSISALDGKKYDGTVKFISPAADEMSGTFTAEIHIPNPGKSGIRAGMTARATLFLSDPEPLIAVPDEALIRHNGITELYRVEQGKAVVTNVSLGSKRGSQTIVNTGLAAGDTIVVVGQDQLGINSTVWIEAVN